MTEIIVLLYPSYINVPTCLRQHGVLWWCRRFSERRLSVQYIYWLAAHQHDPAEQRALFSLVCLIPYVCFSLSNITGQKAWRSAAKVGFRQCFSVEHQGCHVVFIWLFKANNVYAYTKCKPLYSVL